MSNLAVFLPVLLLAIFVRDGESLYCWTCKSEFTSDDRVWPLCSDAFLNRKNPRSFRQMLKKCEPEHPVHPSLLVCQKEWHFDYDTGRIIYERGCAWKNGKDVFTDLCPTPTDPKKLRAGVPLGCEICNTNACNGAATIGKTIALLLAPLGLLLIK